MTQKPLILASTSPYRADLLKQLEIPFEIVPSKYEEDMTLDMPSHKLAMHLAKGKAEEVAKRYTDHIIIGADSFTEHNGKRLGKPKSKDEAKEMLRSYSGSCVELLTGFTVIDSSTGKQVTDYINDKIYFKELSEDTIERYVATEEAMNAAGAFTIQKRGVILVHHIEGTYSGIIGLPLARLADVLEEFGVNVI